MSLNQEGAAAGTGRVHGWLCRGTSGFSSVGELRLVITSLRARLEPAFSPETAMLPRLRPRSVSAGQCGAVATIVRAMLGGQVVSAYVDAQSHWFNRIAVADDVFDVDITGDQFGLPPIQLAQGGKLYSGSRVRRTDEINENTRARAELLAGRAGLGGGAGDRCEFEPVRLDTTNHRRGLVAGQITI
jgi:hypothetical protein